MAKKAKSKLNTISIPKSLLQELEELRVTQTQADSLDTLVEVALEWYMEQFEKPDLIVNGKLNTTLQEFWKMGPRQKRVPRKVNEPMGKVLSLLPYLDPDNDSSEKT